MSENLNLNKERMTYICNKTLENRSIQISNSKIWTFFLDNKLRDFVIEYNFNFYEIANRFHEFIAYPFKYDFSEEEIRRHWSFLNACRYLGNEIDDEYYDILKKNSIILAKEEEEIAKQEKIDFEKDQKEQEKIREERFSMIDISGKEKIKDEIKLEENAIDKTLKNDEQFEKCINNIKVEKEELVDTEITLNKEVININNFEIKFNAEENKDNTDIENKSNKEENSSGLNFEDDDIINALFDNMDNLQLENIEKDLAISNNKTNPEENNENDLDTFPIDTTRVFTNDELTEEELIKKREEMIKEFNDEDLYREIDSTKNFNDLLNEDKKLKKTYDDLNAYFNFTRKSMKFLIPKLENSMSKINKKDKEENENEKEKENEKENAPISLDEIYIKKASDKINQLIFSRVKNFDGENVPQINSHIEEANSQIFSDADAEEDSNYQEIIEEDQKQKKDLFNSYLFSGAKNISTTDLLSQIVEIIKGTYLDEIKTRNENANEEEEEISYVEDNKKVEEISNKKIEEILEKEPEFIIDEDGNRKYKHVYRGVTQLMDNPPKKKVWKRIYDSDDSYYSD